MTARKSPPTPGVARGRERLTPRERQVARLLLKGEKRAAIAAELGICVRCVEFHVANLRDKTRVGSFAGLVAALLRADELD